MTLKKETITEGVIKFNLQQEFVAIEEPDYFDILEHYRQQLVQAKLLGQNSLKYEGYAYGNVSMRIDHQLFIISASQTSGKAQLSINDYAIIEDYNIEKNWVKARGKSPASSETMSHAMLYQLHPDIKFVFHVHSDLLWQQQKLAATADDIEYGTPDMARAIKNLIAQSDSKTSGIFRMLGHKDGIISFAVKAEETAKMLFDRLLDSSNN